MYYFFVLFFVHVNIYRERESECKKTKRMISTEKTERKIKPNRKRNRNRGSENNMNMERGVGEDN